MDEKNIIVWTLSILSPVTLIGMVVYKAVSDINLWEGILNGIILGWPFSLVFGILALGINRRNKLKLPVIFSIFGMILPIIYMVCFSIMAWISW